MEPELLICKVNKIDLIFLYNIVYYCSILLATVGDCPKQQTLNTFCKMLATNAKVSIHYHFTFIQNVWWVGIRLKMGPFWAQNASCLHFIHCYSSKITKIVAKFHWNLQWLSTVKNQWFLRLKILILFGLFPERMIFFVSFRYHR